MEKRDIICPECKGMLDDKYIKDREGRPYKHLYCPKCNIEWRI